MEISVLGAAKQVGRSAFLLKGDKTRVLLDFGVLLGREPAFPVHVKPKDVDGIVLTHAHLDHSGATPLFFLSNGVELHATDLTLELTRLLIEDFIKISGFYLPFEYLELMNMLRRATGVSLNGESQIGEFKVKFLEAGHIPGASIVRLDNGKKSVLYTGDFSADETNLLRSALTDWDEPDVIITESTYATADHPAREDVEEEFVAYLKEVVERGGVALVPAFSVGRAQEMACVLKNKGFPYPVAMDGMALKTNDLLMRHQEYLRDADLFRRSLGSLDIIRSWGERRCIVKQPSVIISPAGMLVGGASVFYNNEIARTSKNAICIVSFQVPGTPGRTLLEKGITLINGRPRKVKAEVRRFDFSGHSGRSTMLDIFKKIKGSPKVLTVHGEAESCIKFAQDLKDLGMESNAPDAGDKLEV
ncbi:MAG: MBL fold metallo-hydrolase [Nitrososphaerales archaeon]